jgi:fibronectin type 3 domain-containing protein
MLAPNGTPIAFTVLSYGNGRYSDYSPDVTVTPTPGPAVPAPTLVSGNQAMQLFWSPVSGASSYRVYRRSKTTTWTQVVTINSLLWTDSDVENGEQFIYAVQTVGPGGVSGWVRTAFGLASPALPPAPRALVVTPGNATLQLEWTPVAGAVSYSVFASSTQGGVYNGIVSTSGAFESRYAAPATNGTPQWFIVIANNASGTSVSTAEISGVASAALPGNSSISATALATPGSVRLNWNAVTGATNYRIYRRAPNTVPMLLLQSALFTADDTGLTTGTGYTYYVQAENGAGVGAWSGPSTVVAP